MSIFKQKAKDFAAAGLNKLPDRGNLFLRYMTGVGGHNLDLDDKTISSLRESTRDYDDKAYKQKVFGPTGTVFEEVENPFVEDVKPRSGAVNPYHGPNKSKDVAHTLGRFTAKVSPDKKSINIKDRYDMINEYEDPDLVSGKIQPKKAFNEVKSIFAKRPPGVNTPITATPATKLARAAMYLSPTKPKAFDVNIDIPYSGDINNREKYN